MTRDNQIDDGTETDLIDDRVVDCHNKSNALNVPNNSFHINEGRLCTALSCDEVEIFSARTPYNIEEDMTKM